MASCARRSRSPAGPELVVLQVWEESAKWLLRRTARWPRSLRFTLTQRLQNHALDVLEGLVQARYEPRTRKANLAEINLRLERMRYLLRVARDSGLEGAAGFESAMRRLDETGRMVHGWRRALGAR